MRLQSWLAPPTALPPGITLPEYHPGTPVMESVPAHVSRAGAYGHPITWCGNSCFLIRASDDLLQSSSHFHKASLQPGPLLDRRPFLGTTSTTQLISCAKGPSSKISSRMSHPIRAQIDLRAFTGGEGPFHWFGCWEKRAVELETEWRLGLTSASAPWQLCDFEKVTWLLWASHLYICEIGLTNRRQRDKRAQSPEGHRGAFKPYLWSLPRLWPWQISWPTTAPDGRCCEWERPHLPLGVLWKIKREDVCVMPGVCLGTKEMFLFLFLFNYKTKVKHAKYLPS